jgi:hypothetical protein
MVVVFPRAIRAQKTINLTTGNREVKGIDGDRRTEPLGQARTVDDIHATDRTDIARARRPPPGRSRVTISATAPC